MSEIDRIIVSTENDEAPWTVGDGGRLRHLKRTKALAQDDTPMLAVVQDAMLSYPGEPDDVWLILQPTQPLRKPEHVQAAIALLQESQADSVVSVVELPLTHSPDFALTIGPGQLFPYTMGDASDYVAYLGDQLTRRQDAERVFIRDGTVYAFWRHTVDKHGTIYGHDCRPLIIPASESCALDTPEDWLEAERRLRA